MWKKRLRTFPRDDHFFFAMKDSRSQLRVDHERRNKGSESRGTHHSIDASNISRSFEHFFLLCFRESMCVFSIGRAHTQLDFDSAGVFVLSLLCILIVFFFLFVSLCLVFVGDVFSRFISLFRIYLSFYLLFIRFPCNPSFNTYLFGSRRDLETNDTVSMLCTFILYISLIISLGSEHARTPDHVFFFYFIFG